MEYAIVTVSEKTFFARLIQLFTWSKWNHVAFYIKSFYLNGIEQKDVIAEINSEVVGVRTKNRVALAFHPELSDNPNFHIWLLEISRENKSEMKL